MPKLWPDATVSNNTMLVVQCEGRIEPERVRSALDRLLDFCPWPASRLRRPFPWGKLHWAAGPRGALAPPPVRHRALDSHEELHEQLEAELNAGIDPKRDPPLRFLILEGAARSSAASFLAVTWFHPLMDPRGGQNLVAHLAHLDHSDGRAPWGGTVPSFTADPDPRPLRERGRLARQSLAYMRTVAQVPHVSPGTVAPAPGRARFHQASFVERTVSSQARRGTTEMCWRLAVAGKAVTELWDRRRLPQLPFLVPISVDLRPKGDAGPTFGNVLAFHFARFMPSETADVPGLAQALRSQMVDALRDRQIEANAVAMEFLKYRPVSRMLRYIPGAARGETFSFNCADLAEFPPALETIFGRRVVNAYHAPAVLPRPGVGMFFNRCASRYNLVVSWVEGAVGEDEVRRIVEVIREAMGWTRIA